MIIRSKAPLRLGFAGGGTDVSPYCDWYGGAILNATISLYAHTAILPREDSKIIFSSVDRGEKYTQDDLSSIEIDGTLDLHKGVFNRILKDFKGEIKSGFELQTYVDAPAGSGLGTSSTLTVSILGAFAEWLRLPLGEYDLAKLAFDIERVDLKMAGGKQDQYAATFGGVNFMEFHENNNVLVNPLRVKEKYLNELSNNLLLFYTKTSRLSSKIIESQTSNVQKKKTDTIESMHKLKEQAVMMKSALLKGELDDIGRILDFGWQHKKKMAKKISNSSIDKIYDAALQAGATGGKISGAGGGGFMVFYCPNLSRANVIKALKNLGGTVHNYEFVSHGLTTWTI